MATIARMHVELIARGDRYQRDIKKAQTATERLRAELTKTRSVVGLMAGAAGFSLAAKAAFELGSRVEETGSKFRTVFGESTNEVQRFIDQFGTLAGLSNEQAQAVTATTGSIVQGMGFAQQASARFSTQVVQLAGDLSSFNNIPIEETSLAIQAALTGEREQLKRLGIVLREADVQQRALAISGGNAEQAALDQTRAMATLELITERAGVAVGDLARTQDSAANRARQLGAEIQNIREELATAFLPAMTWVLERFNEFVKGLQIMGAEAAVFVGNIELVVAKMKFWDREGIQAAEQRLGFLRQAAEEVSMEIVGLGAAVNRTLPPLESLLPPVVDTSEAMKVAARNVRVAVTEFDILGDGLIVTAAHMRKVEAGILGAAAAQRDLNSAIRDAQGLLGSIGSIASVFGGIPFLGEASSLLGGIGGLLGFGGGGGKKKKFAGLFAEGGTIPSGQWGVVGERGPEIVQGPAQVTPMSDAAPSLTLNIPPASSRMERMFHEWLYESLKQLEHNGAKVRLA